MPQFIEHIDAIARKPKRDVLYLEFLKAQRASPLGLPACGRRDLRDGGNQAYDEEDQCPQGVSVMHASATEEHPYAQFHANRRAPGEVLAVP